jgi:hypothetical protein
MADFQYLVAPENRVGQVKKAVMECDGECNNVRVKAINGMILKLNGGRYS